MRIPNGHPLNVGEMSNREVPIYYEQFRDAVVRNEILVNKYIAMEMDRIDDNIQNPDYYYDPGIVNGFIMFAEREMTLTDGSDLYLLPTFKLWAESLLGWYYFSEKSVYDPEFNNGEGGYVRTIIKKRLISKQFLIVARGAAKSMYMSLLQAYFLTVDPMTTHQITTSPTMKQSEEVMSPIRTAMTRSRGPYFKLLTMGSNHATNGKFQDRAQLASTKKGIEFRMNNSILEVLPMTIDKLQGYRPYLSTIDEWLSGNTREDVIGAVEQGASKLDDYIIVAVSSEGTVRNGAGDTIKMELIRILTGEYENPHVSIWYYRLDDIEEVSDPATWVKAQPNIGLTVSYEAYQRDVDRAESEPATRNDIIAKRFGIPLEGYTFYFAYPDTIKHNRYLSFDGGYCAMGADLSQGDDFCAFTFIFPQRNGSFGIKTLSFITERTLHLLPGALRAKYEDFINEGTLFIMNGVILDQEEIYEEVYNYIDEHDYDVRAFGYDPYNADKFVARWNMDFGEAYTIKVPQGFKNESVPLGEIKILAEERMLLFDQEIMTFTMGNAITLEDNKGNRKLFKLRADQKIDNVAAMMDAYIAYNALKDQF